MNTTEILKELCEAPGVAGNEFPASEVAARLVGAYADSVHIDSFGNVCAEINPENNLPVLLLDAHIDEIGMVVTYIDDDGFIKIGRAGGIDRRTMPAQTVTVWGKRPVKGIICTLPPHVAKDGKKAVKEDEIAIDTGFTKEELEALVSLGDKITVDAAFEELLGGRVTAKAVDDRAGVAAILYALSLVEKNALKYRVKVQFSAQEELGGRGAVIAGYNAAPELAIAVDVSFGVSPDVDEAKGAKLGSGTMIGYSPSLDRAMSEELKALAGAKNIPYTIEVMSGATGTNADDICTTRGGVKCALLSIPIRNMHMPAELVQISDIEDTGRLIAEYMKTEVV